jgi:hypothetical protein
LSCEFSESAHSVEGGCACMHPEPFVFHPL